MTALFDVRAEGVESASARLFGIAERAEHLQPGLRDIGDDFRAAERDWFASGGDGLWPPRSRATVKRHGAGKALIETGTLLASLTVQDGPGSIQRVISDTAEFGTSVPYAKYQGRKRPPVVPAGRVARHAADTLLDYIVNGAR